MILKIERLAVEPPMPEQPDPDAAAAVQELMGGRFGEMSTLMNDTFQSFNFRGRAQAKPYYDLMSNISAVDTPLKDVNSARLSHHFMSPVRGRWRPTRWASRGRATTCSTPATSRWTCCTTSSWSAARAQKIRVYEMTAHPIARQTIGYLLVRGGVHQVAYEGPRGADRGHRHQSPERPQHPDFEVPGDAAVGGARAHRILYRFSPDDYPDVDKIWKGPHPEDGQEVTVEQGPPEGAPKPDLPPPADGGSGLRHGRDRRDRHADAARQVGGAGGRRATAVARRGRYCAVAPSSACS